MRWTESMKNVHDKLEGKEQWWHKACQSLFGPNSFLQPRHDFLTLFSVAPIYAFCTRFHGRILSVSTLSMARVPAHTPKSHNRILAARQSRPQMILVPGPFGATSTDKSRLSTQTTFGKCVKTSEILWTSPWLINYVHVFSSKIRVWS